MLFSGTLGKMIHEKNLKQKVPIRQFLSMRNILLMEVGNLFYYLLRTVLKMAETGKINSETNRQKTAQ